MAPLITTSRALARSVPRCCHTQVVAAAAGSAKAPLSTSAARNDSSPGTSSAAASFHSPFRGESKGTKIPDWGHYMSKGTQNSNLLFQYFMVGTLGAISAAGAKSTIQGEWTSWGQMGRRRWPMEPLGGSRVDLRPGKRRRRIGCQCLDAVG